MSDNPLLNITFHIPFDQVRAEHVEPGIRELVIDAQARIDAIVADNAPRTFENTMLALERSTENLHFALGVVSHLEAVSTTPELRAAWNAAEPRASAFYSQIPLNEGLWKQLKQFAETAEAKALTGVRLRFLTKTLDSFRRHGAELDLAGKKRMSEIDVELTKITTKFSENVLDSTNAFEFIITDEARLDGLPPSAVAAARQSAESKGAAGWRFTLQAPSYVPVATYLNDRTIREKFYRAFSARATEPERDNRPLIVRILELRREKARLLGFPDFADFVLHDRMAHRGERAMHFLEELKVKTIPFYEKENAALEAFAGQKIEPWDISYFAEKQRRALYEFDEEQLRPYFPAERVVDGMFAIVERLYGIQVKRREGVPIWHPDVRYYEVHDRDGLLLGAFYADWYPRETKRDGAWMEGFITGVDTPARRHNYLPVGDDDVPRLLRRSHHVHHTVRGVDVEVAVDFAAPHMGVRRHGVPVGAFLQQREAHHELTTAEAVEMDRFVDRALVAGFQRAEMHRAGFDVGLEDGHARRKFCVRGVAEQVEGRGLVRVVARERNLAAAAADIQAVEIAELELLLIDGYGTGGADVQHAHFAAFAEELRTQFGIRFERQRGQCRHRRADHCAVEINVGDL